MLGFFTKPEQKYSDEVMRVIGDKQVWRISSVEWIFFKQCWGYTGHPITPTKIFPEYELEIVLTTGALERDGDSTFWYQTDSLVWRIMEYGPPPPPGLPVCINYTVDRQNSMDMKIVNAVSLTFDTDRLVGLEAVLGIGQEVINLLIKRIQEEANK